MRSRFTDSAGVGQGRGRATAYRISSFWRSTDTHATSPLSMTSSGDPAAGAMAKLLKVLLPLSIQRLRISEELAGCFVAGDGARALVVSPFGRVWRVEVGRDGEGSFLGHGWPEFLAAHGIGVGWFVVLRHEGGGTLTVKAFDTSFCIREFGAPAAVMASRSSKGVSCKPQFVRVIHQEFMEKMIIPAKFVKRYVAKEYLNNRMAIIFSPLGKFWHVEVENDQSSMSFAGGWSQFLVFHGIFEGDVLLLRYEGNMVFKFKAFGLDGCPKDFRNQDTGTQQSIEEQQESPPPSPSRKRKRINESPDCQENENRAPYYQIVLDCHTGQKSWIKKEINSSQLKRLSLSPKFCNRVEFVKSCTVILKTEMDSNRSWQVRGQAYRKACYLLGEGWKSFCQENCIKKGDICTFNIVETKLWHVTITRLSASTDNQKQQESPPSCECKSKNDLSDSEGSEGNKSNNSWSASEGSKGKNDRLSSEGKKRISRCDYELGQPSWIRKELTPYSLQRVLNLPQNFLHAIGLRKSRTIILKTSVNRGKSWQVHCLINKSYKCHMGLGWKRFCEENKLKEGDICIFNVVKTTLWHVVISRP